MAALWFAVVQNTQIKSVKPKETKSRIQFKNESVSPLLYTVTLAVMGVELNCWPAFKDKSVSLLISLKARSGFIKILIYPECVFSFVKKLTSRKILKFLILRALTALINLSKY